MATNVADCVLQRLREWDVEYVFGYPGDGINGLLAAWGRAEDVGYFERMCRSRAVDCLQIDATRCGGYTEWLRSAAVAAAHGLEVSAHCAPHLHAPVAAATPNLRHVEWFHDHVRIEQMMFDGSLDPRGGTVTPAADRLGHGLALRPEVAERYRAA